jgi:superfamily II DNA helicase RecQ
VTLQKDTEKLAAQLRVEGFTARAFHAGMDTATKTKLQDSFMRSDSMIMVATIAFGMGIDKDSIRNVVHFSIPGSLESYSMYTFPCPLPCRSQNIHIDEFDGIIFFPMTII